MMNKQQGFTLIELVAVIVILGALAVVALPRFINLQDEADQAAADGVAGALSAAFATNYAGSLVKSSSVALGSEAGPDEFVVIDDETALETESDVDTSLMTGAPLDGNYEITCGTAFSAGAGDSVECTLDDADSSAQATFTAIATS